MGPYLTLEINCHWDRNSYLLDCAIWKIYRAKYLESTFSPKQIKWMQRGPNRQPLILLQASLAKWLSFCLRTKWLWVRVPLHSLELFCYVSGVFIEDLRSFLKIGQKLGTYWTQTLIIRWALLNKDRYSMKTINVTAIFILENENFIKRLFSPVSLVMADLKNLS